MLNKKQIINFINNINDNVDHYSMNASHISNDNLICLDVNQKYSLFFDNKMNLIAKLHYDANFKSYDDSENTYKYFMYENCQCVLIIFDDSYHDMLYEDLVLFHEDPKDYARLMHYRELEYSDSCDQNN